MRAPAGPEDFGGSDYPDIGLSGNTFARVEASELQPLRILGIDPGSRCGYGAIKVTGSYSITLIELGELDKGAEGQCCYDLVKRLSIDLVAIESIDKVIPRKRFGSKMATGIYHSGVVRGRAEAGARFAGAKISEVTANVWRSLVVGSRCPSDAEVKEAIGRVVSLPSRSNAHERDALGPAIYYVRKEYAVSAAVSKLRFT